MESEVRVDRVDGNSRKSYVKIGRIHNAIKHDLGVEVIKCILQSEGDINYEFFKSQDTVPNLLFDSYVSSKTDIFQLLLDFGADFTRKNVEDKTIVHQLFYAQNNYSNELIDLVLSAHVKFGNFANPSDDNGMTHFHIACMRNNTSAVKLFLNNGVDVNLKVNSKLPRFPSYSPLHFAVRYASSESIAILLKYGANVHLKNADGMSPIHLLIWMCINMLRLSVLSRYEKALDILLRFVISDQKLIDVVDDYGFSKCHWAAMVQDESLVENVLEGVEDINQPVNLDSPVCPGYTPLHFATFSNVDVFKFLMNRGADIDAKSAKGSTAFELCLEKYNVEDIHSILSTKPEWKNIVLSDNKTMLIDIVSAMKNVDEFISFLNCNEISVTIFVPFDSPLWSGYTILHLAVVLSEKIDFDQELALLVLKDNAKIVEECLKRGADIKTPDAKGSTALHVAFDMEELRLVQCLLDHHDDKSGNPVDKNNLSHFHIACATRHRRAVENFLSLGVNVNSQVQSLFSWHLYYENNTNGYPWRHYFICPGSTALHINVASDDDRILEMLLKHGADVNIQDVHGFTPIHRLLSSNIYSAFESRSLWLFSAKNLKNITASCGLTHLHVAFAIGNYLAAKRLLKLGADINAQLTYKCDTIFKSYHESYLDGYGDPDNPLGFLSKYSGYTPLHFAYRRNTSCDLMLWTMKRNANVFIKDDMGVSSLEILLKLDDFCFSSDMFNKNVAIQTYLEREYGITKLHLACSIEEHKLVRKLIKRGANVNAKVYSNSPIWRGHTPLHSIVRKAFERHCEKSNDEKLEKIVRSLVDNGADVLSTDDKRDTPFHLIWYTLPYKMITSQSVASILFEKMENFKINAYTNKQGVSLFHVACIVKNVGIIEKFLNNGIDVNQTVDYFSTSYPGSTPLHLIFKYYHLSSNCGFNEESFIRIVDMLLENGADINAADAFGNTPLFEVIEMRKDSESVMLSRLRRILIQKFISNGADVHAKNLRGETSFELLLKLADTTLEDIELFLKAGCHLNVYNPITNEGYMAEFFTSHWTMDTKLSEDPFYRKIIDNPLISKLDETGRTVLQNIVSIDKTSRKMSPRISLNKYNELHAELIEQLIIRGCDIDHQDIEGKTALHLAVNLKNDNAIMDLLVNGADINLTDKNGDTAFAYSYQEIMLNSQQEYSVGYDRYRAVKAFAEHVYKLEFCGLPVNWQNRQLKIDTLREFPKVNDKLIGFHNAMEKSKYMKIGSTSLSIYDFLMNDDVDVVYMSMKSEEQREIDRFFTSFDKKYFFDYHCLLKLKYRRTIERIKLIRPAMESLNVLFNYQLSEHCCRYVLQFLKNEDLKRVIASMDKVIPMKK